MYRDTIHLNVVDGHALNIINNYLVSCYSEYDLLLIKTVMSEVPRLYDLSQVPLSKTVVSEVTHVYDLP